MAGQEVKVLGSWFSPFVLRVEWALKIKGIEYEYVEEDLGNKSPLLLKLNPIHKRVPVLVHAQNPLVESLLIMEYIDETWKQNPILPLDPYQKAMARFWAKFVEEKLTEVIRRALVTQEGQQEKEVKQARESLEVLEAELKGKKFFGGDNIGFLDIVLGWAPIWLGAIEKVADIQVFDSDKFPRLSEWMQDFLDLSIVKEKLPVQENLVMYLAKIRAMAIGN